MDYFEDLKLNIDTRGQDYTRKDLTNYGYDPTVYSALKRLARSGLITGKDVLLDYGCGKGRVCFFMTNKAGCRSIGIDFNENMLNFAQINHDRNGRDERISFICADAAEFVPTQGTCAFFFNPFGAKVLVSVLNKLKKYSTETDKPFRMFFWYPTYEYKIVLEKTEGIRKIQEIDCRTLFNRSKQLHRIEVWETVIE